MQHLSKKVVVIACAMSLTACASIVGGRYQHVSVEARAADQSVTADCTLSNGSGSVHLAVPGTAVVRRSSQSLNVTCAKDGKQIAQQSYESNVRGMVWGNILFGGLIGIVVDFSNGAAHHYPDKLSVLLPSSYASIPTVPVANGSSYAAQGAPNASPSSSNLASLDRRISSPMFNAAQNIASTKQCDRAIRVLMVDGARAMFEAQCPGADLVQIECEGDHCVALHPAAS
ncbi:hypothetical protein ISN76_17595 [Dyella halodurans]|uniref:Uncharacterized protein n=1 Tax=Dyella halodurans TaxID=1920171 RepID=A0ABV9C8R0_9GAMM|nr:hypothetical protein [Dyella halodurans]